MTVPPCDHCGQLWAHRFDGPPAKRNIGTVIALAVLGGLAVQIPFIVLAAYVYAGLTTHMMMVTQGGIPAGSLRPRLQACELFSKWERTHDPNLLNRAAADARSPRVQWQLEPRFRADLVGLRNSIRRETYVHSPATISHYEHAVQDYCNYVASGLKSRDPARFRRNAAKARSAAALLRRPSTTTRRSTANDAGSSHH